MCDQECVPMEPKEIAFNQGLVGQCREGVDRIGLQINIVEGDDSL